MRTLKRVSKYMLYGVFMALGILGAVVIVYISTTTI